MLVDEANSTILIKTVYAFKESYPFDRHRKIKAHAKGEKTEGAVGHK